MKMIDYVIIGLLFWICLAVAVGAVISETGNNFKISITAEDHEIIKHSIDFEIQNLQDINRDFSLHAYLQDLSFDPDQVENFYIYEWKPVETEIPIYSTMIIEKTCIDGNTSLPYDCSYSENYQTGSEIKNILQWKPSKMSLITQPDKVSADYGSILIPKISSKDKYDDLGAAYDGSGIKKFRIIWETPITQTGSGFGSSGYYAIKDQLSGYDYDPFWNTSYPYCRNITLNDTISGYYQILINFTNLTNMNGGGSGLRFVDDYCNIDSANELDAWKEFNSSDWATWWVKATTNTISVYYGYEDDTDTGNPASVFDIYDDFDSWTGDWSNATCSSGQVADIVIYDGFTTIESYGSIIYREFGNVGIIEARTISDDATESQTYYGFRASNSLDTTNCFLDNGYSTHDEDYSGYQHSILEKTTNKANNATDSPVRNVWYVFSVSFNTTWARSERWADNKTSLLTWISDADTTYTSNYIGMSNYQSRDSYTDWIRVRQYVPDYVSYSIAAEQKPLSADPTETTLTINGASANATHIYNPLTPDNLTASINVSGLWVAIDVNGSTISNGTTTTNINKTYGTGLYNITAWALGNDSFLGSSETYWLTITQASNPLLFTIYNSSGSYPVAANYTSCLWFGWCYAAAYTINDTYPHQVKAVYSCSAGSANATRNNITISNDTWETLGANLTSLYRYTLECSGNANYTANYSMMSIGINKGDPMINITFNESSPVADGTPVLVSCSYPAQLSGVSFSNDTNPISNPYVWETTALNGIYNFSCSNSTGNANYTSGSDSESFEIFLSGGLSISEVYDERSLAPLTFNLSIYNESISYSEQDITSYTNNSVKGNLTIAISSVGYVERNYYIYIGENESYSMQGYLLQNDEGVYIDFWAYSNEEPSGAAQAMTNYSRFINSTWILVEQQRADFEGKGIIFLDPYAEYMVNASKDSLTWEEASYSPNPDFLLRINLAGSTTGSNITWMFSGMNYSLTPSDTFLGRISNLTTICYNISSESDDVEWMALNLSYWNGSSLYYSNESGSPYGTNICIALNSSNLSGSIDAQTFLKVDGYDLATWSRRYSVYWRSSTIPEYLEDIADLGLSDLTEMLIAFFVSLGIGLVVSKMGWSVGGGIGFLAGLSFFVLFGWFSWDFYLGLCLVEAGLLMREGLRGW